MTRFDHDRLYRRDRMRSVGTATITGRMPAGLTWAFWRAARVLPSWPPQPSREQLRREADDAWRQWTGATSASS